MKDKIVDLESNPEFLKNYTENFERGFDSINDHSIILNHVQLLSDTVYFTDPPRELKIKGLIDYPDTK